MIHIISDLLLIVIFTVTYTNVFTDSAEEIQLANMSNTNVCSTHAVCYPEEFNILFVENIQSIKAVGMHAYPRSEFILVSI